MKTILAIFVIAIFIIIAVIHLYWAFGGKKWLNIALPTADGQTPIFRPRMFETLVVAVAFLGFGYIVACEVSDDIADIAKKLTWGIAIIFIIRAIGEFKYVGFFKKIKHTDFGQMDSKYYSPLCLIIGVIVLIIKFL